MSDTKFQGKRVSASWGVILTDAAKRVSFRLNSGRRTMREQTYLWRNRGKPGFASLVAFPNPNAPHIKVGRENHALDVDTRYGDGEQALERELERMGLVIVNDVAGEPWHQTEQSEARLRRIAARLTARDDDTPVLRRGTVNRGAVRRVQTLLRGIGFRSVSVNGKYDLATRVALRRFQRRNGIRPVKDTAIGNKTWALLRKAQG